MSSFIFPSPGPDQTEQSRESDSRISDWGFFYAPLLHQYSKSPISHCMGIIIPPTNLSHM